MAWTDYIILAFSLVAAVAWVMALRADGKRRREHALARAKHERILRYIRLTHSRSDGDGPDGFPFCVECRRPHPCETYRSAAGDPGWPRPADEVLAELGQDRRTTEKQPSTGTTP